MIAIIKLFFIKGKLILIFKLFLYQIYHNIGAVSLFQINVI